MTKSADRVLGTKFVHNFRDYGGYALAGGGRIKRGLLWRSGQHADADAADLGKIAGLDLAHVFDLRSPTERLHMPCRRPEGFAGRVHSIDDVPEDQRGSTEHGQSQHAPHVSAAVPDENMGRAHDAAAMRAAMRRVYEGIAFRPGQIAMMRNYLAVLAQGQGASVINCLAGKDRTGIAVAMLHRALGVHHDDVMADYLLTNTAGDPAARIAAGAQSVRHVVGEIDPAAMDVLMGVEAEYLDTAFAAIRARFGSEEAYLASQLGVDDALRARLRAHLTE